MTNMEVFLNILLSLLCVALFFGLCYMAYRDNPKNWKKELGMMALSEIYRISGWVGFLSVALCFALPDNVGTMQIVGTVIAFLIHFGLRFVDGVKDFDKKSQNLPS